MAELGRLELFQEHSESVIPGSPEMLRQSCCSQCPLAWKGSGVVTGRVRLEGAMPCWTPQPHRTALHCFARFWCPAPDTLHLWLLQDSSSPYPSPLFLLLMDHTPLPFMKIPSAFAKPFFLTFLTHKADPKLSHRIITTHYVYKL